ncbi:MAG: HAD-IB family phosphatase [Pseudomonadota bacterium]
MVSKEYVKFDKIIFDWDGTLSLCEGMDVLAKICGADEKYIASITEDGMNGKIDFRKSFELRIEHLKPNLLDLEKLSNVYFDKLLKNLKEFILEVTAARVYIISCGIRQSILSVTRKLGLKDGHVYAIDLQFDENGNYELYDQGAELLLENGKAELIKKINIEKKGKSIFFGDGANDLSALCVVDKFIGFGGYAQRQIVKERAHEFIVTPDAMDFISCLK